MKKNTLLGMGAALSLLHGVSTNVSSQEVYQKPVDIIFSFEARNTENAPIYEVTPGKTNKLVLIADKPVETRLPTAGIGWKLKQIPQKSLDFYGIAPSLNNAHYGETNDWFYPFTMDSSDINLHDSYRLTKRLLDDNGNFLPRQGPKSGKNAFAYYDFVAKGTNLSSVIIDHEYITPQNSRADFETKRVVPLQIAVVPEPRPTNSLMLYNITADGTPHPYATGCVDENGKPRKLVLQRSSDLQNWMNIHTNQFTAENPFGSINYVDVDAKGKSPVFYRVVGHKTQ